MESKVRPMVISRRSLLAGAAAAPLGWSQLQLSAGAAEQSVFDFSGETVGAEPGSFVAIVGNWVIAADGDNRVLAVDGRKWKEGQASAGLADKARAIYGERYAEFLDDVQAYAYFPYAVAKGIDDFREGEISMRFKPLRGASTRGRASSSTSRPMATT